MRTRVRGIGKRRLILIGIAIVALELAFVVVRYVVPKAAPRLMELMAEQVMPRMMDAYFGQMSADRRTFMLAHCRGMLDRVDEKYQSAAR
jgi:hypothetical protein